jgi:ubiquinone biosynthesis protein
MRRVRLFARLLTIQRTLIRYRLDDVVSATPLFRPFGWLLKLTLRRPAAEPLAVRIRLALEELGPIFVKFGQAVSTRRDQLPADVADELAKLQDRVPPFPSAEARAIIERAFGREVEALYAEFESEPLAAASIAQVHGARLNSGERVVVKLLRPRVRAMIRRDLEVLFALAELAERYWADARRLRPIEVVCEFERTLDGELDLLREAANASQLRRNFQDSDQLYVPQVYWDYCRGNVLTIERVHGIPVSNIAALKASGADIKRLAENGVNIFFTQVFRHNFFHADMHPGNIFVDVTRPEQPRYIAVDFGIVGSLSDSDQRYLAENFLAFFQRDYRRVATLHVDSGWVPADTRIDELEAAVRSVCEPIFNKPLKDISFALVLLRLFETARRFHMQVQPQLVLLQKTLLNIEGLGRQLYPDLDLWKTAQPVLEQWVAERRGPRALVAELVRNWPQIGSDLALLPELLHRLLIRLHAATVHPPVEHEPLRPQHAGLAAVGRSTLSGAALLIAGVLWVGLDTDPRWLGFAASAVGLALMLLGRSAGSSASSSAAIRRRARSRRRRSPR